ncbi:tetratricopeptide repeat protein [uncultured Enterovirga sp.]|uniref:tetratricopeptide repeat protein n=1 Tax=uncultured Enterovirga sp. TaxID=2026352 RepID=UPI0035CBB3EB
MAALAWSGAAFAQPASFTGIAGPVGDPEVEALFGQVLRNPSNPDLSFLFADAAARRGDNEAAIGALERILFYNPALTRVKLELGVLYFRLGSYEMARSYFEAATSSPETSPEVRARVAGFLREIDRRTSIHQFSVYTQVGFRYQSNANAGPASAFVSSFGQDAILGRQFVSRPDWNAFGLAALRHVYDFENQRGDVWETNVAAYGSRQFRFGLLDVGFVEVQTGPRLALAPETFPGLTIRPYGLVNGVTLGDQRYLSTAGGGVSVSVPVANGVVLEPFFESRARRFERSAEYSTASEQAGTLWTTGLLMQGAVASFAEADFRWQARAAYLRNETRALFDYNGYDGVALDVGLPIEFTGPWGARRWLFVPSAGVAHHDYSAANPLVDPIRRRRDREYRVGGLLEMPIYDFAGISLQVQYSEIDSRLRNYDSRNLSISFGPTLRF